MRPDTTPAGLQRHARALAKAFDARVIESDQLRPEEALGLAHIRVVLVAPIIDETTYAIALHEIGHLAAPTGVVRHVASGDRANLMMLEEEAAWTWARHYAIVWTPLMAALAAWAIGTYERARAEAHRHAPAPTPAPEPPAPKPTIDWAAWR